MAEKAAPKRRSAQQKRRGTTRRVLSHFASRPRPEKDGARFYSMHDLYEKKGRRSIVKKTTNLSRLPGFFLFALSVITTCMFVIRTVDAASFQGPTAAPPGGNIPVTIWNRAAATAQQSGAAIDIDGDGGASGAVGISVGSGAFSVPVAKSMIYVNAQNASPGNLMLLSTSTGDRFRIDGSGNASGSGMWSFGGNTVATDLGAGSGGQNLLYGNVRYAAMHSNDALLKLQTSAGVAPTIYTDRLSVDRDGNISASGTVTAAGFATTGGLTIGGDFTAVGDIKSNACFGATVVGVTPAKHHGSVGNVGSYKNANDLCVAAFPGSHVCAVQEVLESIKCAAPADPILNLGGENGWLNGGPPGDPAKEANDCRAWADNTSATFGRVWQFNASGGVGTLTGCNALGGIKYACCK